MLSSKKDPKGGQFYEQEKKSLYSEFSCYLIVHPPLLYRVAVHPLGFGIK